MLGKVGNVLNASKIIIKDESFGIYKGKDLLEGKTAWLEFYTPGRESLTGVLLKSKRPASQRRKRDNVAF